MRQTALKPPPVALAIPGYELGERLGEGPSGEVYRATQLNLNRTVAIKVFRPGPGGVSNEAELRAAACAIAEIKDPRLVGIHDCGFVDGRFYLVMDHVPGRSLRALLDPGKPWPNAHAFDAIDTLAGAVACLHAHGVVHGNLRPENVICSASGELTLTDFGIQRVLRRATIQVHDPRGQEYQAPERRFGMNVDARTDIYALAVIAYELLTGTVPGPNGKACSQLNPRVPKSVDDVLRKGMARDPTQRYASVDAFRRELVRTALNPRRHPIWGPVGVAALTILVCVPFMVLMPWRLPAPPTSGEKSAAPPAAHFAVYHKVEEIAWLGTTEADPIQPDGVRRLHLQDLAANEAVARHLPRGVSPTPALVRRSGSTTHVFHPLPESTAADRLRGDWPRLETRPPTPPSDNFIRGGDFGGKYILTSPTSHAGAWRLDEPQRWKDGELIHAGADGAVTALILSRQAPADPDGQVSCSQTLSFCPQQPGTIVVLRYRARSESGRGHLCVSATQPIQIPTSDRGARANQLRERGTVFNGEWCYCVRDWVAPPAEWHTYLIAWEWPPHAAADRPAVIHIAMTGHGRIWLDEVEMFEWE